MVAILNLVRDPYERKARVTPGLLVVLPLLVPLVCVYGAKNPILTSLVSLLGCCGAIYLLASVARGRGKKLEEKLIQQWGGLPTTIILRHRDSFLDSVSTQRYHALIITKLGLPMPSEQEESLNPDKADDMYLGATRKLREVTRKNQQLLLKENIAYGFHRNMLAMRVVGIVSCLLGILYGLIIADVLQESPSYFNPIHFADPGLPAGLTLLVSFLLLIAWVFYFDADAVKRIGFVYAERLFECLTKIPSSAPKKNKIQSSRGKSIHSSDI